MSKQIDFTTPLTPEEREYAMQFPGLNAGMVEANEAEHGQPAEESLAGSDDGGEEAPYSEWTVKELSAEAKRRNDEEGTSLPTSGTKDTLVKALEEDDAARPPE